MTGILFNLNLKFYHRQPDNVRSIDLVSGTVDVMQCIVEDINSDNMPLLIQASEIRLSMPY